MELLNLARWMKVVAPRFKGESRRGISGHQACHTRKLTNPEVVEKKGGRTGIVRV